MPLIVLARKFQHEQVEFPPGTPRPASRRGDGSLHLRRGSAREVTIEELGWIEKNRKDIFPSLNVLAEPKLSRALARKLGAEKKSSEETVPNDAAGDLVSAPEKASTVESVPAPTPKPQGRPKRLKGDERDTPKG